MKNNNYLKIITLKETDSTNNYAWKLTGKGAKEITVIRAEKQTEGRGRLGREWRSPENKGIYASFILRPQNPLNELVFLPFLFAFGVIKTFKNILTLELKWPNDVMVQGKKLAGVLGETKTKGEARDFFIAGVGININIGKEDLPFSATSLYSETEKTYDMEKSFETLIKEEVNIYRAFKEGKLSTLLKEASFYSNSKDFSNENEIFKRENIENVICLR